MESYPRFYLRTSEDIHGTSRSNLCSTNLYDNLPLQSNHPKEFMIESTKTPIWCLCHVVCLLYRPTYPIVSFSAEGQDEKGKGVTYIVVEHVWLVKLCCCLNTQPLRGIKRYYTGMCLPKEYGI